MIERPHIVTETRRDGGEWRFTYRTRGEAEKAMRVLQEFHRGRTYSITSERGQS